MDDGEVLHVWSRAVDSNYNSQPESAEAMCNIHGLLNNSYGRRTLRIVSDLRKV